VGSFSHIKISPNIEQSISRSRKNLIFLDTIEQEVFAVRFNRTLGETDASLDFVCKFLTTASKPSQMQI
jgi:hypothetical protein